MFFSDSPEKYDTRFFWSLLPNLDCIAADPLHRCLEAEQCFSPSVEEVEEQELPPRTLLLSSSRRNDLVRLCEAN